MKNINEVLKITETVRKFLPSDFDITNHAKVHSYLMMNPEIRRSLLSKLSVQKIPDQIINEYFDLISDAFKTKHEKECLQKITELNRAVLTAMDNFEETATQLIRYWGQDYVYIGYSFKHQRHALIDRPSFIKFNYKVNLIRENMDQYHLTYIENLKDLEIEIK